MNLRCEHCRYWDCSVALRDRSDETGACRRKSPKVNKMTGGAMWPFTEDSDWCGEFDVTRHSNGAPLYAPDGTMLNDQGNRSIFDDVDK